MPDNEPNGFIRFGIFEVDLRAGELRRNGSRIRLQDQPFQVLALLLARPGELVTREDLRAQLWPADTFVDFDHGLNAAVKRLRDALGDSAENPRFIETLARRGYRFLAPLNGHAGEQASPIPPAHSYGRFALVAAVVLLLGVTAGWHAGHRSSASVRFTERRLTSNPENDPVSSAAISPDGHYLAFTARTGFFLRQLGTGETHLIAIPDNGKAQSVSWYPDGSHVLATRTASPVEPPSLWSVSVFGGSPRKLVDSAESGVVSPDGSQILFVRGGFSHQEIWLIRANGEQAHKVMGELGDNVYALVWSPDGRRIAYVLSRYCMGWGETELSIYIRDLASQQASLVLSSPRLRGALAWTPDNRLIYSLSELPPNSQNDANLWAARLDPRGLRTSGSPVQLTSGSDGKMHASISADGKRLIFLRWAESPGIYISTIEGTANRLSPLQRLSLDERRNLPYSWTPDGKSIIFTSDRDGVNHLFKQAINQPAPDLLVGGDESVIIARLNADSTAILYTLNPDTNDPERRVRLMRLPISGGTPQLILSEAAINNFQCARAPSTVCVLSEFSPDHLDFFSFDPATGKKNLFTRIDGTDWYKQNWTLSPDGSTLAMAKMRGVPGPADICLYSLATGASRTLALPAWSAISYLDWAADGRSIWVNASSHSGRETLLSVNLNGVARPFLQESEKDLGWAIPSPDGRHLAIWEASGNSNAWLLEGF